MKTDKRGWKIFCSVLSLVFTANYLFIYEYMIGFEGTRLILLGYVLFQDGIRDVRSLAQRDTEEGLALLGRHGGIFILAHVHLLGEPKCDGCIRIG